MDRNHVMTIDQKVEAMNTEMQKSPKLLQEFVGKEFCCIFRVPQGLRDINEEAYQPQVVSIGPYHYGNKNLEMIQELKWRYLRGFLTRMEKLGMSLKHFYNCIMDMENDIRQSYSEPMEPHYSKVDLVKMMVLDGVFLIELFRKIRASIPKDQDDDPILNMGSDSMDQDDDPILNMVWVLPFLMRDFLRMENQIPFFVLQELFDESKITTKTDTLPSLILKVFKYVFVLPNEVSNKRVEKKTDAPTRNETVENETVRNVTTEKHLLDFFRNHFIKKRDASIGNEKVGKNLLNLFQKFFIKKRNVTANNTSIDRIKPATKLAVAGVKFKNHEAKSFLDIKFQNGVLLIPQIKMDDFFPSFLLNVMAFEQCYSSCPKDITTYLVFLGCLINTSTDVSLLSENKIIENYLGTDEEVVKFINKGKKDVSYDVEKNYLKSEIEGINDYYNNRWHTCWAEFKHKYFKSPWASCSLLAAIVLLLLAVFQTIYTIYPYYDKRM